MTRVPASIALLALRQSGYQVTAATLRQWVRRGHITRGKGGYCLTEIREYIDRRERHDTDVVAPGQNMCHAWC